VIRTEGNENLRRHNSVRGAEERGISHKMSTPRKTDSTQFRGFSDRSLQEGVKLTDSAECFFVHPMEEPKERAEDDDERMKDANLLLGLLLLDDEEMDVQDEKGCDLPGCWRNHPWDRR